MNGGPSARPGPRDAARAAALSGAGRQACARYDSQWFDVSPPAADWPQVPTHSAQTRVTLALAGVVLSEPAAGRRRRAGRARCWRGSGGSSPRPAVSSAEPATNKARIGVRLRARRREVRLGCGAVPQ